MTKGGKKKKKKKKVKDENRSQNYPFQTYIKKNYTVHYSVHGHFSWSMFSSHLVMGPKASKITYLRNRTMGKCRMTWDNFMTRNVQQPLRGRAYYSTDGNPCWAEKRLDENGEDGWMKVADQWMKYDFIQAY